MNRRSFLKFMGVGALAVAIPLPSPVPPYNPLMAGEIGTWQGFRFISTYNLEPLTEGKVPPSTKMVIETYDEREARWVYHHFNDASYALKQKH